jgi:hypothetical protein
MIHIVLPYVRRVGIVVVSLLLSAQLMPSVALACEGGSEEASNLKWIAPTARFKKVAGREEQLATIENFDQNNEYTVTNIALELAAGGPYFSIPNAMERKNCEKTYEKNAVGNANDKCSFKIKYIKEKAPLAAENVVMKATGLLDKPWQLLGE